MASRTPSNGLETANQKQKSQGDSLALGSVFISFSQAFEDRHFTKPCLPHTPFLTGTRGCLQSRRCWLVRPNRSFRAYRSLLTGRQRHEHQTQFPTSTIELRNGPKFRLPSFHSASITAAAANPSATPINGLRTANQKEMFQSEFSGVGFLFMLLSQAFKDRDFRQD